MESLWEQIYSLVALLQNLLHIISHDTMSLFRRMLSKYTQHSNFIFPKNKMNNSPRHPIKHTIRICTHPRGWATVNHSCPTTCITKCLKSRIRPQYSIPNRLEIHKRDFKPRHALRQVEKTSEVLLFECVTGGRLRTTTVVVEDKEMACVGRRFREDGYLVDDRLCCSGEVGGAVGYRDQL